MRSKLTAALTAAAITLTSAAGSVSAMLGKPSEKAIAAAPAKTDKDVNADGSYNYGSALQKSMYFYEVQQSGELPDWNEVVWRDDSMVTDFVEGGWNDAGDHLKFALTNAYSSIMLGWGLLQYGDGVKELGEYDEYMNNLQWGLDYLVGCDLGDEIVYMIGDGAFDHVWWGSAEVYMKKYVLKGGSDPRPYYTCKDSCIESQMAAALSIGYMLLKDTNPEKAKTYLDHATDLFSRADAEREIGNDPEETSYYKISTFYDDLFTAANFLYMATGEQKYLDLCKSDYIPNLGKEEQSSDLKYTWGICWDDMQQAGTLLYAINTGDQTWKNQFRKHLEYWTTGYGGKQITYTPDGLPWLFQWGSLRHATTTAFAAYIACDTIFKDDAADVEKYTKFADRIMNYCFGDNSSNRSYVVGFGEGYTQAWHHRTSSGAWNDKWSNIGQTEGEDAKMHAHTLYGALVGGPDQNDKFSDKIGDYQYTEVAIDYNAGYTGALCALVSKHGGTLDADFPPENDGTPQWDEFFMKASINQAASSYTEIKAFAMNHTAWPARTIKDLSYNYYFDISELVDAGYSIDDVTVKIGYDQHSGDEGKISISEPIQYKDNIYYVKLSFADGSVVMPTGQSEHRSECQFRISIPDNIQGVWDPSNDYSFEGLEQGGEDAMVVTDKITMYDGDTLIWGTEPDGTTPKPTEPTTKDPTETTEKPTSDTTEPTTETATDPTESTTATPTDNTDTTATTASSLTDTTEASQTKVSKWGDVNVDGTVNIADAVLLNKYLVKSASLTEQGEVNADCYNDSKVDANDTLTILKLIVMTYSESDMPVIPKA